MATVDHVVTVEAGYGALVADLRRAFASGLTRPLAWRRTQLERMRAMLVGHEGELVAALAADLGRPPFEARLADLAATVAEIDVALRELATWARDERVRPTWQFVAMRPRIIREPLGVVAVLGAWNYPIQLLLGPVIAALAAGNAVIAKPSELAPRCSELLARLVPHYLDPRAVAIVEGGANVARALLEQRFDHVFFTGGGNVGRIIATAAAKHLTPTTLELGGKSPVIVDRDAAIGITANRIAWAKFLNAGQTCLAPDYVLVHRAVEAQLVDALAARVRAMYGDDPARSPDLGRIVNERHFDRLCGLIDAGGYASIACGGERDRATRYLAPTILRGVSPDAPVMAEEIFGPILPVIAVDDVDEAITFVNGRDKPLALYVFSRSAVTTDRVARSTSSGAVGKNDALSHAAISALPFGGVGPSGMGAYHGRWGFETFSHRKAVVDRPLWFELPMLSAPYRAWKSWTARKLL